MLKQALEFEYEIPEAHMTLGRLNERMGDEEEAQEEYQIGVKQAMKA